MDRRTTIDNLRQELEALTIASRNIERAIRELENQEQQRPQGPVEGPAAVVAPPERDGNEIIVGYRVRFLTKGKYSSTEGTVTHFSRNNIRVFATDDNGVEIPLAPRNVRIINSL